MKLNATIRQALPALPCKKDDILFANGWFVHCAVGMAGGGYPP